MPPNTTTRLPPLTALRAFEAVVRRSSIKDAAGELNLTASAVSHQLRHLEEHLGTSLLKRSARGIDLTPLGAILAAHVELAFRELRLGVSLIRSQQNPSLLRVSVLPVIATELIVPRLQDFERRHPQIQLRVEVSESLSEFESEPIDAAVRIGPEPGAALFSEKLIDLEFTPVCAPSLLEGPNAIRSVPDLARHALLTFEGESEMTLAWRNWAERAGHPALKPARELWFDSFLGGVQAAEAGLGVLMAPHATIARRVSEGRLAMPFRIFAPSAWCYRFVCRRGQEHTPKIQAFHRWIADLCIQYRTSAQALAGIDAAADAVAVPGA